MEMKMKTILAVDDRRNSLKVLAAILADEGYRVIQATSANEALDIYDDDVVIDAVLSDFKMPGMDGLALFKAMSATRQAPPFIIMSAHGTVKSAVQALKEGVAHYLIKPLDYEELVIVIAKAIQEREMSLELDSLKRQVLDEKAFHGIIGATREIEDIFEMVRTVGPTDVSVLIYGETGTGKELLARALHLESRRHDKEIICINSAALADNLLEAELFGYRKGAFTGAATDRRGRLEIADGSTLFLDEIGQMSLRMQAKLLRFLQEKSFEPVGGAETKTVDVRIIAATNLDLAREIEKGKFLQDLLYRIDVINIKLPPLRNRKDDIYLLVHHFIRRYAAKYEKKVQGIEADAMKALARYHWPGNIRELKNYIARSVILSKKEKICINDLSDIRSSIKHQNPGNLASETVQITSGETFNLQDMEKRVILEAMKFCAGNKSHTAKQLGISRKTLYEKLTRYGLT